MMTSLMKWAPNAPLNAPVPRAATGGRKGVPFEWTEAMEEEFNFLKKEMTETVSVQSGSEAQTDN